MQHRSDHSAIHPTPGPGFLGVCVCRSVLRENPDNGFKGKQRGVEEVRGAGKLVLKALQPLWAGGLQRGFI